MSANPPTFGMGPFGSMGYSPMNYSQSSPQNFYNPVNSQVGLPGMNGMESLASYGGNPAGQSGGFQFGLNPETFGMFSQGAGALTSLAQIYGMFQSLGLQKKAFKFAQEGTKRNFNASATAFNEAQASKETARRAYASAGNNDYNSIYAYGTGQKVDKWS